MGCGCCHRREDDVLRDMDERTALLHTENIWNGSDPKKSVQIQVQHAESTHITNHIEQPVEEIETGGKPMSLKERMAALQQNQNCNVNSKIDSLRAERHLENVKVTASSKDHISSLFADKLEKQKKAVHGGASGMTAAKGKMLRKALANPDGIDPSKAFEVVQSLGLLMVKEDRRRKRRDDSNPPNDATLEVMNMNNNAMMRTMSVSERENMEDLLCRAMVSTRGLHQVQMCNADVNDAFLTKIIKTLSANRERHEITELWLESNPIGDDGMRELAQFMIDDDRIEIIKLYNNKKTISTAVLNELLEALSRNRTIVKFVFDGFRFQHQKDKREKYLRRNQEIARKLRNEQRKRLQMTHET